MSPILRPWPYHTRRDTVFAVPASNASPVPVWAFLLVSSAAVVALCLGALLCCFLARRTSAAPRADPDRDPSVQMRREVAGYYAPRVAAVARPKKTRWHPRQRGGEVEAVGGGRREEEGDMAVQERLRAALRGHWEPSRRGRRKGERGQG